MLHILGGAVAGGLLVFLLFVHENTSIRDVPVWGFALMLAAAFAGAVIASAIHLQDEDSDDQNNQNE